MQADSNLVTTRQVAVYVDNELESTIKLVEALLHLLKEFRERVKCDCTYLMDRTQNEESASRKALETIAWITHECNTYTTNRINQLALQALAGETP